MEFIGRKAELAILEQQYALPTGALFVLYGRRRVGKTELLKQFCKRKPSVFFTASQVEAPDNLQQFLEACAHDLHDPYLLDAGFNTIEAVLTYITNKYTGRKLVIVLDEFQYWTQGQKALPSLLQRFWDRTGQSAKIMLVLCGSYVSLMIDETLAEKSPLYGRRTGQLQVQPFDYRTASWFFPKWAAYSRLAAYGILGGMPAYLAQFDPDAGLEENITLNLLSKGTFLSEESAFLLRSELRDVRVYATLLKTIASGNTTMKDISSKMTLDSRALSFYLSNLQSLGLVSRQVSMFEPAPEKSRKGRYLIEDNFLNFWFRFVEPHITLLELGAGKRLFQARISPQLDTYLGGVFEVMCRQFVRFYGSEVGLPLPVRVGGAWDKDFDLDVVAENLDGSYTVGECKWSRKPLDSKPANLLKERAQLPPLKTKRVHLVVFSPASAGRTNVSGVRLVSSRELLGEQ